MDKIIEILTELHPEHDFNNSADFIKDGLLDSFDIISLVTEIEEKFDVLIDAFDIVPENFNSVEAIVNMVRKNGGSI